MLPKTHRITTELFQKIMKEGAFVSGSIFTFRYIPQKITQYAFVAPKNPFKTAVVRNKLRRQGYSALKSVGYVPMAGIFFYKKQSKRPTFEEIKADIALVLSRFRLQ